MKREHLIILVYLAGLISLLAFLAVRNLTLYNVFSIEKMIPEYWDNLKYGELYYFNSIKDFREDGIPSPAPKFRLGDKQASVQEADIIVVGDSYLDFSRQPQMPEIIADSLQAKVHFFYGDFPLDYLATQDSRGDRPRILLYARTERWVYNMFDEKYNPFKRQDKVYKGVSKYLVQVKNWLFYKRTEEMYTALLQRSYLTSGIYAWFATLKFKVLGYHSKFTPKFIVNKDRPWLFFHDQVNEEVTSFYYQHTQQEVDAMSDSIASLSARLWEQHQLKLVFMVVPAKYTLYHDLLNNDEYNQFIPRLQAGLETRGVSYINLLELYRENKYPYINYGTDDHWTRHGVEITAKEVLKRLRNEKLYQEPGDRAMIVKN